MGKRTGKLVANHLQLFSTSEGDAAKVAKRISLRDFQRQLSDRLSVAMAGESERALLGFQSGQEYWLTDLADSGEIIPLPPLAPVPLVKPWFRGIANIRGTLYNVIDFSAFQGGEATTVNADTRLLIPNARLEVGSALMVARALGLRAADGLEARPSVSDPRPWVSGEFDDNQGHAWKLLAFEALLTSSQFLDVAV